MNTKRLNIKLDGETHKAIKRMALEQEISLQALIVHLIKQAVYQTGKLA